MFLSQRWTQKDSGNCVLVATLDTKGFWQLIVAAMANTGSMLETKQLYNNNVPNLVPTGKLAKWYPKAFLVSEMDDSDLRVALFTTFQSGSRNDYEAHSV